MIKYLMIIVVLGSLCSCWPTRVGFVDDSMPEEWKDFYVTPLELNAATAPANYNATLTESIRTGVQNNTRLKMLTETNDSAVQISGTVNSYNTTPQAVTDDDNASQQLSDVESQLLELINQQIVQDVINKLRSNW